MVDQAVVRRSNRCDPLLERLWRAYLLDAEFAGLVEVMESLAADGFVAAGDGWLDPLLLDFESGWFGAEHGFAVSFCRQLADVGPYLWWKVEESE